MNSYFQLCGPVIPGLCYPFVMPVLARSGWRTWDLSVERRSKWFGRARRASFESMASASGSVALIKTRSPSALDVNTKRN